MEQNAAVLLTVVLICVVLGAAFLFPAKSRERKE
jgi:hypothetical protein